MNRSCMILCIGIIANYCYASEQDTSAENEQLPHVIYTIVKDGRINFAFPSTVTINSYMMHNDYRTLRYRIKSTIPDFNSYIVPLHNEGCRAALLNLIPTDEESKMIFIEWYQSGQLNDQLDVDGAEV